MRSRLDFFFSFFILFSFFTFALYSVVFIVFIFCLGKLKSLTFHRHRNLFGCKTICECAQAAKRDKNRCRCLALLLLRSNVHASPRNGVTSSFKLFNRFSCGNMCVCVCVCVVFSIASSTNKTHFVLLLCARDGKCLVFVHWLCFSMCAPHTSIS